MITHHERKGDIKMGIAINELPEHWIAAMTFNKALALPVRWKSVQTVSYRSGRGMYDYNNRASKYHVLLMDDFKQGRIKRGKGDFLCNAKVTDPSTHQAINMNEMDIEASKRHKVTCPKCLERIEKLKK
jgi:hypothetical protein